MNFGIITSRLPEKKKVEEKYIVSGDIKGLKQKFALKSEARNSKSEIDRSRAKSRDTKV
jgi:hypothetical protein